MVKNPSMDIMYPVTLPPIFNLHIYHYFKYN